jgi:hypothetical protein
MNAETLNSNIVMRVLCKQVPIDMKQLNMES